MPGALYPVTAEDIAIKCIRTIWPYRHYEDARRVIRKHLSLIRRHRLGTGFHSLNSPRDAAMKESRRPCISPSGN